METEREEGYYWVKTGYYTPSWEWEVAYWDTCTMWLGENKLDEGSTYEYGPRIYPPDHKETD
jgi:hypothetical protein